MKKSKKKEKTGVSQQRVASIFDELADVLGFDWFIRTEVGELRNKPVIYVYCDWMPDKDLTHKRWATLGDYALIYKLESSSKT